jgi:N-acetylglutamate synthase-like GNAT family acetyltransferase
MDIKIAYLKDHSEKIPTLAKIWYEVLGSIWISDISIEQVEQGFYDELNHSSLPLTLVALKSTQVIGAVSLHENDEIRADLAPWLESLVVDKAYQNQGVGKLLVQEVKQKARDLHFKKLYLFAFEPNLVTYYEQLGFRSIGIDRFKDRAITIMESTL